MDNSKYIASEKTGKYLSKNIETFFPAIATFIITASVAMANPPPQKQVFNDVKPDFSALLTFNKLNASDTLASIKISLYLQVNGGTIIIDNDADTNACGTFEFGKNAQLNSIDVLLTGGPGKAQAYNFLSVNLGSNVDDGDSDYSPLPPDGNEYNGSIVSDSQSGFIDSSIWSQYQGTGTFDIMVSVSLQTNYIGSGKVEYFLTTPINVAGYVEVAYTYVPEPATIILLCTGALTLLKRKKRGKFNRHST